MIATLWMLHRIRKRMPANTWYVYRSLTVETALIGTMAAGLFSSRGYGESIYWMCALAFALYRMQSTELENAIRDPASADIDVRASGELPLPAVARTRAHAS
jgi:hypothetical protein